MKTFRVYASQEVIYYKEVKADTAEQAEQLAWENDDTSWIDVQYGDWQLEQGTEEITNA